MKLYSLLLCFLGFIILQMAFLPTKVAAHGKEKHNKTSAVADSAHQRPAVIETKPDTASNAGKRAVEVAVVPKADQKLHAAMEDFPHIHPLIVHFPIMLLMVAAAMQFLNILFQQKALNWAVLIMVVLGFISAYAASHWSHPHTSGLSAHAELVLEQHDKYAEYTIYLSGLGLLAQLLTVFVFRGKRWSAAVAALILIGAGYAVSMAGHYGAQLVHIEGVGPQGKYLEKHHH